MRTRRPPQAEQGRLREELLVVLAHVLGVRLAHAPHHRVDGALVAHLEGARAPRALASGPSRARRRCRRAGPCGGPRAASFHGLLRSMPRSRATARTMSVPQLVPSPTAPSGFTAPSLTERSGFGTTSSGSISMRVPRPEQSGHMPCGRVEGEELRRRLGERDAAVVAGAVLATSPARARPRGPRSRCPGRSAAPSPPSRARRCFMSGLGDQPVHHRVDGVLLLLVEPDLVLERRARCRPPGPG